MKISKVKNTNGKLTINARTAVVVADYGQEGILYDDPIGRGKGRKSTEQSEIYIKKRTGTSRRLYSIFSKADAKNKKQNNKKNDKTNAEIAEKKLFLAFDDKNGAKLQSIINKDNTLIYEKYAFKSYENRKAGIKYSPDFSSLG